jgi:hypothetical protein
VKWSIAVLLACSAVASPALAADEVHWTFTGPTSVTVDWRGSETSVRYGLTTSYGSTVTAVTPSPLPFSSSGPFKEARITGLAANTTYHYSVGTGADHVFRTLPGPGSTFKVYVEGDIGDAGTYTRVGQVQSLIAAGSPTFVIAVGDLTYGNAHGQTVVDHHFNDVMVWSQDAAYMPAWGNHEWDSSGDDLRNYKGRFQFPNPQTSPGAPAAGCCGEDWYWFDAGVVRFIAYPEPWSGALSDWNTHAKTLMDQAQADPAIKYIVTFGHRPAYSSGHHAGESTLKGYLDALGDGHSKYVLNFNGHSHDYERSKPQHGVTHITAGIGGSSLEEDGTCLWLGGCPPPSWVAFRAFHHGAVRMTITPTSILVEAICGPAGDSSTNKNDISCSSGSVFDSYQIGTQSPVAVGDPPTPRDGSFAIDLISPNPASGRLDFAYSLPESGPASVEMFDIAGRMVMHRDVMDGVGHHHLTIDREPAFAAGTYWLRLSQSGRSTASKVVFVR